MYRPKNNEMCYSVFIRDIAADCGEKWRLRSRNKSTGLITVIATEIQEVWCSEGWWSTIPWPERYWVMKSCFWPYDNKYTVIREKEKWSKWLWVHWSYLEAWEQLLKEILCVPANDCLTDSSFGYKHWLSQDCRCGQRAAGSAHTATEATCS